MLWLTQWLIEYNDSDSFTLMHYLKPGKDDTYALTWYNNIKTFENHV